MREGRGCRRHRLRHVGLLVERSNDPITLGEFSDRLVHVLLGEGTGWTLVGGHELYRSGGNRDFVRFDAVAETIAA